MLKKVGLFALFCLNIFLISLIGFAIFSWKGLVFSFVFSVIFFVILFIFSPDIVLRTHRASSFERLSSSNSQLLGLLSIVDRLAFKLYTGVPEVYLINEVFPYVFSVGHNKYNWKIAVSTGLISSLDYDELESVLTYEFIKSRSGSLLENTVAAAVFFTYLKFLLNEEKKKPGVLYILRLAFLAIFSPLLILLHRIIKPKQKELEDLDFQVAKNFESSFSFAKALRKIANMHNVYKEEDIAWMRNLVSFLYVVNPTPRGSLLQSEQNDVLGFTNKRIDTLLQRI